MKTIFVDDENVFLNDENVSSTQMKTYFSMMKNISFDQKWGKKVQLWNTSSSWFGIQVVASSFSGGPGTFLYYTQESNEQKLHPSIFGVA